MDLVSLVRSMDEEDKFMRVMRNPLSQFGNDLRNVVYLGSQILPRINSTKGNSYREDDIKIRPLIADDSGRYSTPQLKSRKVQQSLKVELGEIDAKRRIEAQDIDILNNLLKHGTQAQAEISLLEMIDLQGLQPINDKKELQTWQAITTGELEFTIGKVTEKISYGFPAAHIFDAGGDISDNAFDPMTLFTKAKKLLKAAGYSLEWTICRESVATDLQENDNVKRSFGDLTITDALDLSVNKRLSGEGQLNPYLRRQGFPPITTYDGDYYTQTEHKFFIPDDVLIFIGRTPRMYPVSNPVGDRLLTFNTLGYYSVGTPQAQDEPGDVVKVTPADDDKPSYIQVVSYGTGLPVIQEPEAIIVVKNLYNV